MPTRTLIVVPAWNEEATVASVVTEIRALHPAAAVLVVNDGSTDATSSRASEAGALVLDLPVNLGVGGAMRAGYLFAYRTDVDWVVQMDADGQHDPRDLRALLSVLDAGEADIVIGARFAGTGSYRIRGPRRWVIGLLSFVLSRVAHTRLTDTTSGFKACNRAAIRLFATNYPAEYLGDTIESLVIAARSGLRVRQVGVAMRPRAGGKPSHSPVKAAVFLVRAIVALIVALSRPTEPAAGEVSG